MYTDPKGLGLRIYNPHTNMMSQNGPYEDNCPSTRGNGGAVVESLSSPTGLLGIRMLGGLGYIGHCLNSLKGLFWGLYMGLYSEAY